MGDLLAWKWWKRELSSGKLSEFKGTRVEPKIRITVSTSTVVESHIPLHGIGYVADSFKSVSRFIHKS
jgi:hypothetical protein